MKFPLKYTWLWLLLLLVFTRTLPAQQPAGIAGIEKLYDAKDYTAAENLLNDAVKNLLQTKHTDSLVTYIQWTGKLENKKTDAAKAIAKVKLLTTKITTLTADPETLSQVYIEAAEFYGLLSKNELAFATEEQALTYAIKAADADRILRLANIENNLATYAQRMGDISLSIAHGRKALQWLEQLQKPDYDKAYLIYNSIGTGMYYQSKLDSSLLFFHKALNALSKAAPTPENKYYRPAIIQNNIAGIYGVQGKATAGIAAMKSTIENLKLFLATKAPHKKKPNALQFQFEATDNLAGIYKDLGDYRQAQNLLEYSYEQKKQQLPAGDRGVFVSEILLGQLYFATRDFDKSLQFLNRGLANIAASDEDNLLSQADANSTLALLYEEKKQPEKAAVFYEKADSLYEASLAGEYDNIYLEFLTNAATFYAVNKQPSVALAKANKGYQYILQTEGPQSLSASQQLLNLSEVAYHAANYQQAIIYGDKALEVINLRIQNSENLLDSVKTESRKLKAILIKAKAQYQLLPQKTVAALSAMLQELDGALALLERKKALIDDPENNSLLLADNNELLEFIKQISYDLYQLTHDPEYLDRLVGLHESGMYNRIRSRLAQNDSLQFIHVPPAAQATEKKLKAAITAALQGDGSHDQKMQQYFAAVKEWNQYQETLRTQYPRYYAMRYASVFKTGNTLQQAIPEGVSVVRYFYIDKKLYAFVADAQHKQVYALNGGAADVLIQSLPHYNRDAVKTGELLHALYQQLWAPFAANIRHQKVVIIPDGNLYNLSFETLTPQRISSFTELATKSLLSKYAIAYHYSLFLLKPAGNRTEPTENFVAFAPGFSDDIKSKYKNTLQKQETPDNSYLKLLPQPFTVNLVNKIRETFDGEAYVNDQSTTGTFKANAGGHRIIHIGTHAEANNLHPEYSRLIFTKNVTQKEEDNSLFLPDIYNCNLNSDLTVLTACESGRPGYQDGEGMISLAHAFNYAGSESILTSLWKIDEQASAAIMEIFYQNLAKGMAKDEALRQAKLYYLAHNNGRMLSPQYWAGLVMMGDTSPLKIVQKSNAVYYWLAGGIALLLLIIFTTKSRRHKE